MLLYVHVPFCARRCSYCDFAIAVRRDVPSLAFAEMVEREWRSRLASPWWESSPEVETIYFGGGTPSHVVPAALGRIIKAVRADRVVRPDAEVTLEANPEDVTPEAADAWLALGINRVSLGAQSFHPNVLEWMHRTHTANEIGRSVRDLRWAGFANLSLDLIYGVPEALERNWLADLDAALALEPDHLSLYALTVESATPLGKWTARGTAKPLADDRVALEFAAAHTRLSAHGFQHYEVSNAARPGFRAVHNAGYWRRAPFIGLGPSAHSGAGRERLWNLREYEAWRKAVESGADPTDGNEVLNDEQILLEERYLGLRTDQGVPEELIPDPHRTMWMDQGWAVSRDGRLRLTAEGWLRLDALVGGI